MKSIQISLKNKKKSNIKKFLTFVLRKVFLILDKIPEHHDIKSHILDVVEDFLIYIILHMEYKKIQINKKMILSFCKKNYNKSIYFHLNYSILKRLINYL